MVVSGGNVAGFEPTKNCRTQQRQKRVPAVRISLAVGDPRNSREEIGDGATQRGPIDLIFSFKSKFKSQSRVLGRAHFGLPGERAWLRAEARKMGLIVRLPMRAGPLANNPREPCGELLWLGSAAPKSTGRRQHWLRTRRQSASQAATLVAIAILSFHRQDHQHTYSVKMVSSHTTQCQQQRSQHHRQHTYAQTSPPHPRHIDPEHMQHIGALPLEHRPTSRLQKHLPCMPTSQQPYRLSQSCMPSAGCWPTWISSMWCATRRTEVRPLRSVIVVDRDGRRNSMDRSVTVAFSTRL